MLSHSIPNSVHSFFCLLYSLKRRKYDVGKPNFVGQLLGAARFLLQVLVERTNTGETEMQEGDNDGEVSVGGNEVQYKTIESVRLDSLLQHDEPTGGNADAERSPRPHMKETTTEKVDNTVITENPRQKNVSQASSLADTGTSAVSGSLKLTSNVSKVAFVSVKRPVPSKETGSNGGDMTCILQLAHLWKSQ
ncbi:hypothetical protein V6N11_020889 [Hibiscus sabdariffa]|uniref:Uncharacterized protein n=1 Tax=Hibiscus sabdariffa TaxID=183260 RepID=A0ABR2QA76_9ROSI